MVITELETKKLLFSSVYFRSDHKSLEILVKCICLKKQGNLAR